MASKRKKISVKLDGKDYCGFITEKKSSKSTGKKSGKKSGAMGSKIMDKAKQIKKSNPGMKWTDCVKKAAKQLKK